jgi:hypothetical protein
MGYMKRGGAVSGSMRRRRWIVAVVLCLCAAVSLGIWWFIPPRICLGFRKVEKLSRLDELKRSYPGQYDILRLACGSDKWEYFDSIGEHEVYGTRPNETGVRSDGKGYYMIYDRTKYPLDAKSLLYAFDADGKIMAKSDMVSLGLAPDDGVDAIVGVSNDVVWISAHRYVEMPRDLASLSEVHFVPTEGGELRRVMRDILLEVNLEGGHFRGVVRKVGDFESGVVDGETRRAYLCRGIHHPVVEMYDIDKGRAWERYTLGARDSSAFIDYLKGEGIVLSDHGARNAQSSPMIVIRSDGTVVEMSRGMNAVWGSDGYAYYAEGTTRIWRCKPGGKPEPVFLGTSVLRSGYWVWNDPIYPGADRSFLYLKCFRRPWYGWSPDYETSVLLDLKTKEYVIGQE